MNYRVAVTSDLEAINGLCRDNGIAPPSADQSVIFVADDNGTIRGVAGVKVTVQLEPLVGQTPFIAQALAERSFGFITAISKGPVVILVHDDREDWLSVLERYGFTITDRHMTVLKKEL